MGPLKRPAGRPYVGGACRGAIAGRKPISIRAQLAGSRDDRNQEAADFPAGRPLSVWILR